MPSSTCAYSPTPGIHHLIWSQLTCFHKHRFFPSTHMSLLRVTGSCPLCAKSFPEYQIRCQCKQETCWPEQVSCPNKSPNIKRLFPGRYSTGMASKVWTLLAFLSLIIQSLISRDWQAAYLDGQICAVWSDHFLVMTTIPETKGL